AARIHARRGALGWTAANGQDDRCTNFEPTDVDRRRQCAVGARCRRRNPPYRHNGRGATTRKLIILVLRRGPTCFLRLPSANATWNVSTTLPTGPSPRRSTWR